jgi:hypothetical protein
MIGCRKLHDVVRQATARALHFAGLMKSLERARFGHGAVQDQVRANLIMADLNDELLEQMVSRLSLEPGVSAVSWKVVENGAP